MKRPSSARPPARAQSANGFAAVERQALQAKIQNPAGSQVVKKPSASEESGLKQCDISNAPTKAEPAIKLKRPASASLVRNTISSRRNMNPSKGESCNTANFVSPAARASARLHELDTTKQSAIRVVRTLESPSLKDPAQLGRTSDSGDNIALGASLKNSIVDMATPKLAFTFRRDSTVDDVAKPLIKQTNRASLGGVGKKPNFETASSTLFLGSATAQTRDATKASHNSSLLQKEGGPKLHQLSTDSLGGESTMSEQECTRSRRLSRLRSFESLLPGSEAFGFPRENAHLQRVLKSADRLYPVRYAFQRMGLQELNRIVYEELDPNALVTTLSPDIYSGAWSCCRSVNVNTRGCRKGKHSDTNLICVRCGVIYDVNTIREAPGICMYHSGAIFRSKAGGVWWQCCGAVGFKNSLFHSLGGDIHGPQDWRWGCCNDITHKPLQIFEHTTDVQKYAHCTTGAILLSGRYGMEQETTLLSTDLEWVDSGLPIQCMRLVGITVIGQPLIPTVIGMQIHYEDVIAGDIADGERRMGNPGIISPDDHLKQIVEDRFELDIDEYLVSIEGEFHEYFIFRLTVRTSKKRTYNFFENWKRERGEKALNELNTKKKPGATENTAFFLKAQPHELIVGFQYGLDYGLTSLGILTQTRLSKMVPESEDECDVRRCTLCSEFYLSGKDEGCRFHPGFWTPQRRMRVPDASTMPKCKAQCEAKNCAQRCSKYEHRSYVITHSCGSSQCAEKCQILGCTRRCYFPDHFHGTKDPLAVHTCNLSHPCKEKCICGQACNYRAKKGENPVRHIHWCGSDSGCSFPCYVEGCTNNCASSNHLHGLDPNCQHICDRDHPCFEKCSASSCDLKCAEDRATPHVHRCCEGEKLGCVVVCRVQGCGRICKDENHFHGQRPDADHICEGDHPCMKMCDAPGCRNQCGLSRAEPHEVHKCSKGRILPCLFSCSMPNCSRQCKNAQHFHGLDLFQYPGETTLVPKQPHNCQGFHQCTSHCTAYACLGFCTSDAAVLNHVHLCDGNVGCRHRCWFGNITGCPNFCGSTDHRHKTNHHLCISEHLCPDLCKIKEPCIWISKPQGSSAGQILRKRQRKPCAHFIPVGLTAHEEMHDCCGQHARPVVFDESKNPEICTVRCDKFGCRKRCRYPIDLGSHLALEDSIESPVVHCCDQPLCLEPCQYPNCRKFCTLLHLHTVSNEDANCYCCPEHDTNSQGVPPPEQELQLRQEQLALLQSASLPKAAGASKVKATWKGNGSPSANVGRFTNATEKYGSHLKLYSGFQYPKTVVQESKCVPSPPKKLGNYLCVLCTGIEVAAEGQCCEYCANDNQI